MKVAYDSKLMRPACVLIAAGMGASSEAARRFDIGHWLLHPTPDMKVYETSEAQLQRLLEMTEQRHGVRRMP